MMTMAMFETPGGVLPPLCLRLVIYRFFASPHACRLSLTAGDDEAGNDEAGDDEAGDVEAGDDEAGDDEAGDEEASDRDTNGDSPDVSMLLQGVCLHCLI